MGFFHYEHRTGRNRQSLSRALAAPLHAFLRRSGQPSVFSRNEGTDEAKPKTTCDDDTSRLVKPACVRISTFLHARRHHVYRVVNLCVGTVEGRGALEKIATAAVFHDLGI